MNRMCILFFLLFLFQGATLAQKSDTELLQAIYREALTDRTAYENLRQLCLTTSGRITGSGEAEEAVGFTLHLMQSMNLDSVWKQPVLVPHWERGEIEEAVILVPNRAPEKVTVAALGMSTGTGTRGLAAPVVEVLDFGQLEALGTGGIKGKIVFYNRPMDPGLINTFTAYGQAGDQRTQGAARAAAFGAAGVVVRSLTTALDDFPHTGVLRYTEGVEKIPAVAISTLGADRLSQRLKEDPGLTFWFRTTCQTHPDGMSANVIGEIRGSLYPDQIITVGGHLDTWDVGEGAHDDGAGCIQSIEVLRLFKKVGIQPKRTIRAVMFMDEEIAQRGGQEYARIAVTKGEQHWLAIESDRGGLLPLAIGISTNPERFCKMAALREYFEPYGIYRITEGGGGVDIGPLRKSGAALASVIPDPQRYFDYHHSANDNFTQVNIRELQLGSAAMAALIYLVDLYDL